MSGAEVQAALAIPGQTMIVATLLPDGRPHLTAVWYGYTRDGQLGFTAYSASQKIRNLRRDPRITVLVEAGNEHGELRGVQITGRAALDESLPVKLQLSDSIDRRYPGTPGRSDPEKAMARRVAVLIEPQHVASWDHRKLATAGRHRD